MEYILAEPVYKRKVWGGSRLQELFPAKGAIPEDTGESWEVSTCRAGLTGFTYKEFKGKTAAELAVEYPGVLPEELPLLIKFIDAGDNLSVQVHPSDKDSSDKGLENGKTECWYVVDAAVGAGIVTGFNRSVTEAEIRESVRRGTLDGLLNTIPVKPGDLLYIPGGTVHAILKDTVIYEVQQSSDTTYRLYDWDRVDPATGEGRDLHIEDALSVINKSPDNINPVTPEVLFQDERIQISRRIDQRYFVLKEILFRQEGVFMPEIKEGFQVFTVISGEILSAGHRFLPGITFILPGKSEGSGLSGTSGTRLLCTAQPER